MTLPPDRRPDPIAGRAGAPVLLDLRPLQEPERAPITAAYLGRLVAGLAAGPGLQEAIVALLRLFRPDPLRTSARESPELSGRRWVLPTTRALGVAGLVIDRPLLRLAAARIDGGRPGERSRAVFHTAGGVAPARSPWPVVAALLDLAPWELPGRYARTPFARFGHRQRAAMLRGAARVIVVSTATAEAAARLLDLPPERLVVVPLAAHDAIAPGPPDPVRLARLREDLRLPDRYLVVGGRWDARSDLPTVLAALAALREAPPSMRSLGEPSGVPPTLVLAGAAGYDAAGPSRVAALVERERVPDLVRLTPPLDTEDLAALTAGAVAHVQPALSEATGLPALDALGAGVPVIASRTGPLPEIVGPAGIIVEPRDPGRMAMALRALWDGGPVADQVRRTAQVRAAGGRRRWADVARETRAVWAAAAADGTPERDPGTR
jgi:glycosyltransferase involved in cell wall biosynthesis